MVIVIVVIVVVIVVVVVVVVVIVAIAVVSAVILLDLITGNKELAGCASWLLCLYVYPSLACSLLTV